MVARSLHKSGEVFMGDKLLRSADNPEGHFEDMSFLKINKDILAHFGGSWRNPPSIDVDEAVSVFGVRIQEAAEKSVKQAKKLGFRSWGFKDPRTCITFPVFKEVLEDISIVSTRRDSLSVAKSLKKWHKVPIDEGVKLNDYYNNLIIKALEL